MEATQSRKKLNYSGENPRIFWRSQADLLVATVKDSQLTLMASEYPGMVQNSIHISVTLDGATKPELQREMTDAEISHLRSDAEKLTWIATRASPFSAFHASIVLQRHCEQKIPPLQLLVDTWKTPSMIKERELSALKYIPLD